MNYQNRPEPEESLYKTSPVHVSPYHSEYVDLPGEPPLDGVGIKPHIPIVRGLEEAEFLAPQFDHVISVGPDTRHWDHPDHIVEIFDDVTAGPRAARYEQTARILQWAEQRHGRVLVHCHAGVSRSTAIGFGVLIGRGLQPMEAWTTLRDVHPSRCQHGPYKGSWKTFAPNRLIVSQVLAFYGYTGFIPPGR